MEFSYDIRGDILVILLMGENLDAMNATPFKEEILNLIKKTGHIKVIFDLSRLRFIDSSGLGTFLSIQRTLNKQGGSLKLAHLNKPVQTIFEIVSMHRIFDIFPEVEDAINTF